MVTCTGHIGIHEGAHGRTDVYDVMAIKRNFLTSMGYHIFLTMVLRARAPSPRAELRYKPNQMLVFEERGKPEYTQKTSRSRVENRQTQPTYGGRIRESIPDHICGKRVLSPLRLPCSP